MKCLAVIQARMGSSRLPGKVMEEVGGLPIIQYMISRLNQAKHIDHLLVATTTSESDNTLVNYLKNQNIPFIRGPEDDVLSRFCQAAEPYPDHNILRLTADCPLIDANIVDKLIKFFSQESCDYAWIHETYAEGLDAEIFTSDSLKQANTHSKLLSQREHVTQFINKNPDKFKCIPLVNTRDDSQYRIVVDEPQDLEVVRIIASHFKSIQGDSYFDFDQIKQFLDAREDIMKINNHIERNEGLRISIENDRLV